MSDTLEQDVQTLWPLLLEIVADAEKRLAAHLATHHLTPPQFFVLKTLVEHGGRCPIGQIAREHHLTNATMTGLVKRLTLTKPPLVARERSQTDGRSIDVVLTRAGQARYDAVQAELHNQVKLVLSLLSDEERHNLVEKISIYVHLIVHQFPVVDI